MSSKPPILLIHGLWMTPSSWDTWATRFREAGHPVVVPGWPGIGDRTPPDIRRDPSGLANRGIAEILDSFEAVIRGLDELPIIMGHSFGGIFTQVLLDRGLARAAVAVEPGNTAGVRALPLSTLRTGAPVLSNPFRRRGTTPISRGHFHFTFGNDLTRSESDREWEASAIPSYNRVFFEGVLSILNEKSGVTRVDYMKPDRAPLLLISGGIDHVAPPAIQKAALKRYAAGPSIVERKEFAGRSHRIVSQNGWEEVADFALVWASEMGDRHAAVMTRS
ncbi:non-heme chloroperoxidase [Microbacteriaceae bacterium SG_E_30_P1]|uniref:Non-heme chloroperoxidase n=1 Tax=Antiquaquibacter oligotrophicus TaxID=2880260 RepID=A0ABT6KK01_9MICO|nr:alpha/beta hydrolase [Antiquaquibacter oligotrophicus]MDH6180333.1 non-heme chloroperoxidase [Antiquaquibacter oligotrophicus]UDF13921.1 alpha/beta hydrolase [Antiquaquibacter oligotrophicus]